jgi:hypothetical protein
MDHSLGPFHSGPTQRRGRETTGEWPRRCSGLPVLAGGGREGEGWCGGLAMGLTGARERRSGRTTRVKWRRWWDSAGACSDVGEEERGAVSGEGYSRVEVPFYRGRGRAPGDVSGRHQRRNGRRREW